MRIAFVPVVVLVLVSVLVGATAAHAVELESLGVKLGGAVQFPEFAFDGTDGLDDETTFGFVGGVSSIWELQRRSAFRIVLETLYVQKGYEGVRSIDGVDAEPVDVSVNADYLSVPILLRVLFAEDDLSIYAVFGPSLEFLLSKDDDVLLDEFESFAMALNVGLGLEYELGETQAQFELRFNRDVTSNFGGDDDVFALDEMFYQMLQVTAGVRF